MGACERARSGTRKRLLSECDEVERRRIRDTSSVGSDELGGWETRRCSSPFVGRRGRVTGRDLDRARRRCASPQGACGSRRDARLAEAAGMTAREVPTGAFHARCRKRNDRSRMRRWLVCHVDSANQLLIDRRPGFNKRTGVDVKRSARPRAARASPRPRRLEPPPDGPSITRPCDSVSWPSTPHSSPASSTRLAPRPRNPHPRGRFPASLRRPVRFLRAT